MSLNILTLCGVGFLPMSCWLVNHNPLFVQTTEVPMPCATI
ncbi:TPA: hypothetical protein ACXZW1_004319 [Salmonella enterica]